MKKIKIIVLSYVTRKVLILSEKYDFLSFDLYNKSITPELLDLIQTRYFNYMGRYLNFFISHPLCEIENTIYLLAFSCVEHFPNSKLSYNWVDLINIKSSVFLKNILSKNIYKKIKIKYNKNCLFKFNNKVIHGSKQAYSRIIPLKIIHQEISIYNDPNILDCFYLNNIVEKSKINTDEFIIDEKESKSWSIVNMLPALLKKHRKVIMHTTPQGCNIGDRSLGIYFYIMKLFGVKIEIGNSKTFLEYNPVPQNREINIPVFASYTATSMAVYFSLLNGSITKIKNISIEPEIIFLLKCINKLGYSYDLNGRTLLIDGSRNKKVSLSQKLYIPIDRNVLVTQIIDALYENNTYKYNFLNEIYLDGLYFQLKTFGINIECNNYEIKIPKKQHIKNNKYVCNFGHYPELCSDWQPLITLLLCKNNNEKYSKFFWTKSRIYYILSETEHNESQRTEYYNIALSSIKKAWMTEKNGKQYNVRIMTYRSCEIYIKNNFLLESSRREVDKLQEKQNEIIQDINNEFNELKNHNLELLGLFVAIISFTIGTIQLNKQADFFSQACLIIVLMGGVLVVYGGLGIILHGKKYPLRSFLVILIGILLIILSMSTFIILKFGDA